MKLVGRIANSVMYVLMIISVILAALTMFGPSENPGAEMATPVYLGSIINWTIGMLLGAILLVLIFGLIQIISNPGSAIKTLIMLVVTAVVIGVCWSMSDGTPLHLIGYEGSDNVPFRLQIADTGIYLFYIMFGLSIVSIVATEVYQMFK